MVMVDNYKEKIKSYLDTEMLLRKYMPSTKTIGTCINCDALLSDKNYGKKLAQNFNIVTTENNMKWQFIHPSEANYSFIETDLIVDYCEKNNISVRGHCLVWHEALPDWVWKIYKSKDYSRLKSVLLSHVETIVIRYKNKIKEYDVLNEIFSIDSNNKEGFRNKAENDNFESPWFNAFGKQIYIDVLQKIKTIDPSIECWINDFGIDQKGFISLLKKIINFINYANNLGLGKLIDGLSFQCHNYDPIGDPSIASELKSNMQMVINDCGIKVRVSELDVAFASKNDSLFTDKLQVCLDLPNCFSYGMWGFTDKYGSMNSPIVKKGSDNLKNPNYNCYISDGLILDEFYNEKKAYEKMLDMII
jgi:endo-1,4-beta-xylanase